MILSLLASALLSFSASSVTEISAQESVSWEQISLPGAHGEETPSIGFAGVYSAFLGNNLIVAGGANFPEGLPSDGGRKVWHRDVYVYDGETWISYPDALPTEMAYGASAVAGDGSLLMIGGNNGAGCLDGIWKMTLSEDGPSMSQIARLPFPLSNMASTAVGRTLYLLGGFSGNGGTAESCFLSIDLSAPEEGAKVLNGFPGEARAFAVAAAQSDGLDVCAYFFSGRDVDEAGLWTVLNDGWEYNPRLDQWKEVKGEFPVMAGSATAYGTNHILFAGGRRFDGTDSTDNRLFLYHTVTGTIIEVPVENETIPVTTCLVRKEDSFYLVSGEIAAGVRTPVILKGTLSGNIKPIGAVDTVVIILYFLLLACMGWYFSRKQKNADDYFKGGGRIPWFVVGLSIFGTALSAITFMSLPAKAYATDWSYMMFNLGIVLVVPIIVLMFIPFYRKLNVTTAYEYLEKRFNPFVRVLSSLSFILFQIGRMGVVLLLPSIALNIVTGFDITLCIALMGVFALIYTYLGGIEAVAWTDALQVVVLIGAAVTVVCAICTSIPGGISEVVSIGISDAKYNLGSLDFDLKQATLWTVLIATVFTNITTYGTDQTIVQRYLTTETERQARKGVYTNALLSIPATVLFFFVGTCLYAYFKVNPVELSPSINDADAILPYYVSLHLPKGVMGLVIAGIFAAAMSTLSASMNSAATAYVTDIHLKLPRKNGTDQLRVAKNATVVIGAVGISFALMMHSWNIASLWDEFSKILGLLLGGLGGLFMLGLICRKANSAGAISGLAAGMIVQLVVMREHSVYLLLYSSVGFITCFAVGLLVSLCTGGSRKDVSELTIFRKPHETK